MVVVWGSGGLCWAQYIYIHTHTPTHIHFKAMIFPPRVVLAAPHNFSMSYLHYSVQMFLDFHFAFFFDQCNV